MKKYFVLSIAVLFTLSAVNVFAGQEVPTPYVGFGMHSGTYEEPPYEVDITGVKVKLGVYFVEDILAIEANYLYGWGDFYGADIDGDILSIFLRGDLPLAEQVRLYGMIGYSSLSMTLSAYGYSDTFSDQDPSFGGGLEFEIHKDLRIGIEYILYADETYYRYGGFNFMLIKLF